MTTCERNNTKWWYFQHFSFISRLWNWASFQFHNLAGRLPPGSFDSVPVHQQNFHNFSPLSILQFGSLPVLLILDHTCPNLNIFIIWIWIGEDLTKLNTLLNVTQHISSLYAASPFTTSQPLPLKIWVAPNSVEQRKKIAWLWFQLFLHLENSWMHFSTLFCNLRTAIWWAKEYLQILFCQNSYCIEF